MTTPTTASHDTGLLAKLVRRVIPGQIAVAVMLFLPAGTFNFWQGWAFMGVMCLLPLFFLIYFYKHDPRVLERRLLRKETARVQRVIIFLLRQVVCLSILLSALDQRLGWSRRITGPVPLWLTALALLIIFAGQLLFFRVLQSNSFAASIIQVETGQTVAAEGPYRFVRHPMYVAGTLMWLVTPLALGSFVAMPLSALVIPIFVWRLLHEESVLRRELPGYDEYCLRTRYRLIPGVW